MDITFCKPTFGIEESFALMKVMQSGWLAAGEKTKEFEEEFAKYVGVKHAIFTNSCTSALKMAYKYYKEERDQTVFSCPKNTYSATYAAGIEMGLEQVEEDEGVKVTVHYGGLKDESLCDIEDSAHRIEKNDPLIGKIRCYSFYVTKNITTGSGGMFVTNDEDIYKKARLWWSDGINKSTFDRQHGGWNYRVLADAGGYDGNDLAAAIGIEQLKKLPEFTKKRNEITKTYNEAFNQDWKGNHLYPFMVRTHDEISSLINHLAKDGIQASYHYPGTGWLGVSLPIYPLLTDEEQTRIINSVLTWETER